LLAGICLFTGLTAAASGPDYCQSGKQVRRLRAFFAEKIPIPPEGMPLDQALEREQIWLRAVREKAREHLRRSPPEDLARMMQEYTFLIPEGMREKWGLAEMVGMSEISLAVKYQSQLWRVYLERFATTKEAVGPDPYTARFEVDLDLGIFCGYRQTVRDLVVGKVAQP
jgi:hypothetical protein